MPRFALVLPFFLATAVPGLAAVVIQEDELNGPFLSRDINDPTELTFTIGENTVGGTVARALVERNVDVYTFNVPAGSVLDRITVDAWNSVDNLAFFAIDTGTTFPYGPDEFDSIANDPFNPFPEDAFLGGAVFGGDDVAPQFDLLARAGTSAGARFTGPLPADDYTIYVQQTGPTTDYALTFTLTPVATVPEPGSLVGLAVLGVMGLYRRRSKRSSTSGSRL